MRKIILGIIGVLLIIGAVFASKYIAEANEKVTPKAKKVVKTAVVDTVQNKTIPIIIKTQGNLAALRRLELYAEVQGVLQKGAKLFKPGQKYRAGQTLLRINSAEYYATVQAQKSDLFNQITAIMPDLRLDYPESFEKWQNYINNFDIKKAVPPLPEISSDKERYFIAGRNIETAFYNMKNLEQRLSKYQISAPFSGILTEALVTEGTLVRTGQKLGEYIDTSQYELVVSISKEYANLLEIGQTVNLTSIDQNKSYKGTVARINGSIDQSSQTLSAYITVKDDSLREGMYLEAALSAKEEKDAYAIDRNLLQDDDRIFVVRDSILDFITVKPVYFTEKEAVVKGIPDGTIVLSKPIIGAYNGMLVEVYQEKTSKDKVSSKQTTEKAQ